MTFRCWRRRSRRRSVLARCIREQPELWRHRGRSGRAYDTKRDSSANPISHKTKAVVGFSRTTSSLDSADLDEDDDEEWVNPNTNTRNAARSCTTPLPAAAAHHASSLRLNCPVAPRAVGKVKRRARLTYRSRRASRRAKTTHAVYHR